MSETPFPPPVGYRNSASCFVRADVVRRGGRKKEVSEYELFLRRLYLFGGEIRDPGSLKNSRRLPRGETQNSTFAFDFFSLMQMLYYNISFCEKRFIKLQVV